MGMKFQMIVALAAIAMGSQATAKITTTVLRLQERISMEELATNVQNPSSAHYRKFYTPQEIRELSAPSPQEYSAILQQIRSEGFTVVKESPTHLWISVRGDSALFENVFSTKLQLTADGLGLQQLQKSTVPLRLPGVASVIGLDTRQKAFPRLKVMGWFGNKPGGISADKIKSAYGFDALYAAGINGTGQNIAIATYGGYHIDDVNHFYQFLKLNPMPTVDTVEFNGAAKINSGAAMETQLDSEFAGMIAPGASIHVFTSAQNSDAGEAQLFTAILDDNRSKVVNYSWGACEAQLADDHRAEMAKIFARAVAQGVNILVASGDSGSDSCNSGTTAADYPASNPNVVAVGGTTLSVQNGTMSETAWKGSGGGISGMFDLPIWQQYLGAPYVKRSYPDVSFNADPHSGQAIWAHGGIFGFPGWTVIGGTSMAAPQWAGFLALVGNARQAAGKETLGFMNPIIYGTTLAERGNLFNDVVTGTNGAYQAGTDWDPVTGFGSMKAEALLHFLAAH